MQPCPANKTSLSLLNQSGFEGWCCRNFGLISTERGNLYIRVSKVTIDRGLRLMDTLIKSLQVRGHQIRSTNEATEIIINNQKLKISLREKTKRIPGKEQWSYSEYQPTGTLVLKLDEIFHYKEWSDSKLILEEQISAIIAKLELITSAIIARELIWQKERDQKEHIKQLKKDLERRQIQDLEDFKEMIRKASLWHRANNLREYIKTVEVKAT